MRIAIVGAGISGMTVAHLLCGEHDVTVYEAEGRLGGHTRTLDVESRAGAQAIDTGFIVHNDRTYPNFIRLMSDLKVARQPTAMSFSVRRESSGLEYCGTSLNTLFAQRRNLARPSFLRMIRDIMRFNRRAVQWLENENDDMTLDEFLAAGRYSRVFIEDYLIPMGAAIWSADPDRFGAFPARSFIRFFKNHGLLQVRDRPQWYSMVGGARSYIEPMTAPYKDRVRLDAPVSRIVRAPEGVTVEARGCESETFDHVIIATHSDQALAMLAEPTDAEREVLGAIAYQPNDVILHTDISQLPRSRRAWAAWNYHSPVESAGRVTVTYNMNILQRLETPEVFCVSLNRGEAVLDSRKRDEHVFHHPVYDTAAFGAQRRHSEISGADRIHFCGAYWGYGFHEDGVNSALAVAKFFGKGLS